MSDRQCRVVRQDCSWRSVPNIPTYLPSSFTHFRHPPKPNCSAGRSSMNLLGPSPTHCFTRSDLFRKYFFFTNTDTFKLAGRVSQWSDLLLGVLVFPSSWIALKANVFYPSRISLDTGRKHKYASLYSNDRVNATTRFSNNRGCKEKLTRCVGALYAQAFTRQIFLSGC